MLQAWVSARAVEGAQRQAAWDPDKWCLAVTSGFDPSIVVVVAAVLCIESDNHPKSIMDDRLLNRVQLDVG
jgi:hypothetical protein